MDERVDSNEGLSGPKHAECLEASIGDLITHEMWAGEYIGIRVISPGVGLKFVCDSDPNEVYSAIRKDRKNFPDSMYYFYKPKEPDLEREGLLIGCYREARNSQ